MFTLSYMTIMPLDLLLQKHNLTLLKQGKKSWLALFSHTHKNCISFLSCINRINLVYVSFIFNKATKCAHTVEYMYNLSCLLHVSAHTAPSSGRTLLTCSILSNYCNAVTLVTKLKICHVPVLQTYVQLLEQYLARCYVLTFV